MGGNQILVVVINVVAVYGYMFTSQSVNESRDTHIVSVHQDATYCRIVSNGLIIVVHTTYYDE